MKKGEFCLISLGVSIQLLLEHNHRLVLLNPELADSVIDPDMRITHCQRRHHPQIMVAAVRFVNHAHMVCLDNPEIAKCRASRHNEGDMEWSKGR